MSTPNICCICLKPLCTKKSIECHVCNKLSHFKCNYLNFVDCQIIKNSNQDWHCILCAKNFFPFVDLNDYRFDVLTGNTRKYLVDDNTLVLKPPHNLSSLFNQFNDLTTDKNEDTENVLNCKYFDVNDLRKLDIGNNQKKSSLSLFHLNISSLPKHIDSLENLIASTQINFDIIAISESRLNKDNVHAHNLNLQNYSFEYCPTESSAGGTVLYIKNSLSYISRPDLQLYKSNQLESNFVEIINHKKTNIVIGCIYRHPSMDLEEFNECYLGMLLEKLSKENKTVFLMGDFNVDLLKYDKHNLTNEFLDSLSSNYFLPLILLPTRITMSSKTLIDNIFSNKISQNITSGNISASISDHLPQFSIIPEIFSNVSFPKSNIFERDWSKFDKENFILDFFSVDWKQTINIETNDVNKSFQSFIENMNLLLDKYAPYKKISKYKLRFKTKPWLTQDLQKSIEIKNSTFKKYIRAKDKVTKSRLHEQYKEQRNVLSTLMKQSKERYYNDFFQKNLKNIRNTWKGIKSLISNSECGLFIPQTIYSNGTTSSEPNDIANSFNSYFCTVAKEIQSSIRYSFKCFQDYLNSNFDMSFFISPTDSTEVSDIISNLTTDKSEGPNGIPTKILHLLKNDISHIFADLFNKSFSTGVFPSALKIAKILPIHKKGSKLECNNYRPISILSNLDKMLEKLMHKRIYSYLETNNIIYNLQFGFRKNYSTTLALLSLTDDINYQLDNGKFGCGIFIDFQKAFDTVDHSILLKKLSHYGIRGKANDWFQSYLSERKQFVSINGFKSDLKEIQCGVPQGSVLGPLLFLIYINDLYSSIKFCKVHHFADDTNLLHFHDSVKSLNKSINYDLKQLVHWLNANKIALNVGKTELVFFKPKNKRTDFDLNIKLAGKKLYPSSSVKYLGIKIDENLNWKDQQNSIAIKLNKGNAILSKLKKYVNNVVLRSIYFSIFESHLNYASIVWGQNVDSSNRLFLLQKKAIRTLSFADRLAHTNPLFSSANILKFYNKISVENCIFINKSISRHLPEIFQEWFIFSTSTHTHHLRSGSLGILKVPSFKTKSHGRLSFRTNAIYTWNNLQKQFKDFIFSNSYYNKNKSFLTKYYLDQY